MMRSLLYLILITVTTNAQDGGAIYKARCAQCHDAPTGRVPTFSALRAMTPATVMQALQSGPMKPQAAGLTNAELYALVTFLASASANTAAPPPASAFCSAKTPASSKTPETAAWNGWGANLANTRFQSPAAAGMEAADVPKLKLKWAFGLGEGTAPRSQSTIGNGSLFVAGLTREVYALDARSGCIQWTFQPEAKVHTAIVFSKSAIYFGDDRANTYAVDTSNGKLLWKVHAADHFAAVPSGAPQLHDGVLYVPFSSYEEALAGSPTYECCTFRGNIVALDAATGKRLWTAFTIHEAAHPLQAQSSTGGKTLGPSGAAVWSTPTFDEKLDVLYISTGDNYSDPPTATSDAVLALDAKTGKLLWSKQVTVNDVYNMGSKAKGRDFDFGQPPILVSLPNGKRALVIGQKSGIAYGLDPDRQGEILWKMPLGRGGPLGGIQWGSAADNGKMYVALSDLTMAGVPDKTAPQGYRLELNPNQGGGLFALQLASGEKAWSAQPVNCGERKNCSPAQSAAITAIEGVVFSGSLDGHLRAYSARTGEVIWDADTVRDYATLNGEKARGGSLDVAGPVIAGGMLYVNSGYGQWGGMPGNVLLAFSIDGK
jgi:polyvinyl alcohol dehydrogenase (cytochrome)